MKEKILPFIKKYPMSILLAIIALNLFSIAGSLKTEAELNRQKLLCAKMSGFYNKEEQRAEEFAEELKDKFDFIYFASVSDYYRSLNGHF